jgi:hypothetical protein
MSGLPPLIKNVPEKARSRFFQKIPKIKTSGPWEGLVRWIPET